MSLQFSNEDRLFPTIEFNHRIQSKQQFSTVMGFLFSSFELVGITIIFFFLYQWRTSNEFNLDFMDFTLTMPRLSQYLIFFIIFIMMHTVLSYHYKLFAFQSTTGFFDELFKVFKSYGFAVLTAIGISFLLKFADFSRLVIISFWGSALGFTLLIRTVKRLLSYRLASLGILCKNVIVVGAGKVGKSLMDELESHKWLGYKVIGFVDDNFREDYQHNRFLGSTNEIKKILYHTYVDDVIITIPSERELVNTLITDLRKLNIKIKIVPDLFNMVMSTVQIDNINALPTVTLIKTPMNGINLLVKRAFDIILSLILLIFLLPLFIVTALAVKLDSAGPVLYKHIRVGKNGRPFHMMKFRSMIHGADQLKQDLLNVNEIQGPAFKLKRDPRVTKTGAFLRKYSIDELPQLFNVLMGHMSLVGPRPPLPTEVEQYGDWEWRRLEVVPGITGLWQVSGRSDLSFQQWMNLDIFYIENWSLVLDLKILLKTIPVVLKGEGAY